jgi:hypothetical protein
MAEELDINSAFLDDPDSAGLLPVEHIVDGVTKKKEYLFEVCAAEQKGTTKDASKKMLVCKFGTDYKGYRVYVDHYFSYDPSFVKPLSNFVKVLGLPTKGLHAEDFLTKFFWATIQRTTYQSKKEFEDDGVTPKTIYQNKIETFLRVASPEDISGPEGDPDNMPF